MQTNMGSLMFFAPEMFEKNRSFKGTQTDLWALGITFYYLLAGQYPYDATSFFELKRQVLEEDICFDLIKEGPRELLE